MRCSRIRLRRPAAWPAVLLFGLLSGAWPAKAQAPDNIEYTFARRNDSLVVWLNLARYFGDEQFEGLTDGIDYACRYEIALKRPRRIWGAEQVARVEGQVRVGYRSVTRNYTLTVFDRDSLEQSREFVAGDSLLQFLADSIWVATAAIDSLDRGAHYVMDLRISTISLTTFNLATEDEADDGPDSPVKYLFRQFLKATGYGREDYSTSSRKFSLSEIYPID